MPLPVIDGTSGDAFIRVVEVLGRPLRWIFETALLCIAGTMLLGVFRGGFPLSIFWGDADTWAWTGNLPAIGWWLGMVIGLVRFPSVLRKPIMTKIDQEQDSSIVDTAPTNVVNRTEAKKLPFAARLRSARTGLIYGALLGGFVGLMISVSGCLIATAALLSPVAPASWTAALRVESGPIQTRPDASERRVSRPVQDSPNANSEASFWHRIFGWIITVGLGGSFMIGIVGLGVCGWYSIPSADRLSHPEDRPGSVDP